MELESMFNFSDILERNDCAILDTSACIINSSWYRDFIYGAGTFRSIRHRGADEELESIRSFLALIHDSSVLSVPGVSLEIGRARDMFSDKIKFLNRANEEFLKKKRPRREFARYGNNDNPLFEVRDLMHRCYIQSRRSEFKPGDTKKYNFLGGLLINVAERTHSKVDFGFRDFFERRKIKDVEDFHTDEQIVATALYILSTEDKSVAIITRDSDIERITLNSINEDCLSGLRRSMLKNRMRIYYIQNDGVGKCTFDSFLDSASYVE